MHMFRGRAAKNEITSSGYNECMESTTHTH